MHSMSATTCLPTTVWFISVSTSQIISMCLCDTCGFLRVFVTGGFPQLDIPCGSTASLETPPRHCRCMWRPKCHPTPGSWRDDQHGIEPCTRGLKEPTIHEDVARMQKDVETSQESPSEMCSQISVNLFSLSDSFSLKNPDKPEWYEPRVK